MQIDEVGGACTSIRLRCRCRCSGGRISLFLVCGCRRFYSFYGRGCLQFGPNTTSGVAISAHGVGPDASGSIMVETPPGPFHATVTCLQVTGNDGIVTAIIDRSRAFDNPVGEIIVVEGVDNGHPSGGASPDLLRVSFQKDGAITPTDQAGCWLPLLPPVAQQANITVSSGS